MTREANASFDESTRTTGELRKMNALRKWVGNEIAQEAFASAANTRPDHR